MTDDRWARPGRRPWIPDELAGRYDIERELGAGAAAVTVAALDRRLGRRVAIKLLKPEEQRDADFAQRFTREARAAAAINQPNVVSVYDVGQEDDLYWLVMQFVDGTDLKALIAREGALPWQRAVAIARDVLAGLNAIHDAGIVHRDIKPQNVLVGRDGAVKVTDFGVAHVERDTSLTAAGSTVGTAAYMAPEQAQGQAPTPAADVYAVGVMLYEMVTGRLPFDEPTAVATMLAHIQRNPPPPAVPRGMAALPPGVVQVIAQAMAKDPRARFRSAQAMRRALEFPEAVAMPAAATGRTEVVPSLRQQPAPPRPARAAGGGTAMALTPPATGKPSRGFAGPFVTALVVLAVALVAVAGTLWLVEGRPNLFAGGNDPAPTATVAPATEAPAVIEPAGQTPTPTPTQEPSPTPTPTPEPPTPTPSPEPTQPLIVPAEPTTAVDPSTGEGQPQIIEPIEGSTVTPGS
jgi:serine/threonine-protein kinase